MSVPVRQRGFLLGLAAEGMASHISGCATGPTGQGSDHAINLFGPSIVDRWRNWLIDQPPGVRHAAITELADLSAARVRSDATSAIERLAPDASAEDRSLAVEYLCALPRSFQMTLVLDPISGGRVLPSGHAPDDVEVLRRLLPVDAPPYSPGSELPGTNYKLGDVLSTANGVVYRATRNGEPVTVRFPLMRDAIDRLKQQMIQLERVRELGRQTWHERLVRLLDFDLDHRTPFLVYEPASGGTLDYLLLNLREQAHRGFTAEEVLRLIQQIAEGLAFGHQHGVVHGSVESVNVIVSGDTVKLANLGCGSGEPRDDLYSLGVLWYQLLVGDLKRQSTVEDARQLTIPQHELLLRCLGDRDDRPLDASAFLDALHQGTGKVLTGEEHAASVVSPEEIRRQRQQKRELLHGLRDIRDHLQEYAQKRRESRRISRVDVWLALPIAVAVFLTIYFTSGQFIIANMLGLSVGMVFLLKRFQGRQKFAHSARAALDRQIETLTELNPDEVAGWGGPHALRNAELVLEVIAALEEDMRALAIQEQEEQTQ